MMAEASGRPIGRPLIYALKGAAENALLLPVASLVSAPELQQSLAAIRATICRQPRIIRLRVTGVTKFRITVARIETAVRSEPQEQVCVTFLVERGPISFQIPVLLSAHDFDDTEMIRVARDALHRTFVQLAAASVDWELTPAELQRLSNLNVRPGESSRKQEQN